MKDFNKECWDLVKNSGLISGAWEGDEWESLPTGSPHDYQKEFAEIFRAIAQKAEESKKYQ